MKQEQQVITLEQAKKLEFFGINATASFYWHFGSGMKWQLLPWGYFDPEGEGADYFPAYGVAELGVALPSFPEFNWESYYHLGDNEWICQYNGLIEGRYLTEAQARAYLLIKFLRDNLITPEQVNERLK